MPQPRYFPGPTGAEQEEALVRDLKKTRCNCHFCFVFGIGIAIKQKGGECVVKSMFWRDI